MPPAAPIPELVAHRGWARRYPENTRAALAGAVSAGARWLETDVQLSADREPVLFHDRDLRRLCGATGAVHERDLAGLRELRAAEAGRFGAQHADEPIATLADLVTILAGAPHVRAFVELKRVALAAFGHAVTLERTLAVLAPVLERCVLISFSIDFLAHARRHAEVPIGPVLERWSDLDRPEVAALAPEYVFCDREELPAAGRLDARGARLAVYEVDRPEEALALAARGVELVETFAVGEMLAALGEPSR